MLLAVYGSLRIGCRNHGHLKGSSYVRSEVLMLPYKMIDLGHFPALIADKDLHEIHVDIFRVNDATLSQIDRLEGYYGDSHPYNFYNRITINSGLCYIYVLNRNVGQRVQLTVVSGDWYRRLREKNEYC